MYLRSVVGQLGGFVVVAVSITCLEPQLGKLGWLSLPLVSSSSRLDWACLIANDSRASWGLDFELACCHSYLFLLVKSSHRASPDSGSRHHFMMERDAKSPYKGYGGKRVGNCSCLTALCLWKSGWEHLPPVLSSFVTHFAVPLKIK